MCVTKISVCGRTPVFRLSIVTVRSEDAAPLLYGFDIKSVLIARTKEPNIFGDVLPILASAAFLFPFPGDPVLQFEIPAPGTFDGR